MPPSGDEKTLADRAKRGKCRARPTGARGLRLPEATCSSCSGGHRGGVQISQVLPGRAQETQARPPSGTPRRPGNVGTGEMMIPSDGCMENKLHVLTYRVVYTLFPGPITIPMLPRANGLRLTQSPFQLGGPSRALASSTGTFCAVPSSEQGVALYSPCGKQQQQNPSLSEDVRAPTSAPLVTLGHT